jgi:peptide/nickel transport system substrate-binding protein
MRVRRNRARFVIGLSTLLSVLAFAVGCGGSSNVATTDGQSSQSKSTLTIGLIGSGTSLNPALNGAGTPIQISSLTYAPLIHQKGDGSLEPALATSWRYVGSGNRVFRLELRKDARFSDGTPVTPDAVKTWLEYFARAGGPLAGTLSIGSVRTIGDSTVELRLAQPDPSVPYALSENANLGFVASPRAVANPKQLGARTFGAGPYTVVPSESVAGDHYTFVPNKHFYDKSKIHFGKVVVKVVGSPTTMLQAAKTGQIDVAQGDAVTADAAAAAGLNVISAKASTGALALMDRGGTLNRALTDLRVRQALNYAVDREAITKAILGRYASPSSEFLSTDGLDPEYQDYYAYDPEKAKALLADAGYARGLTLSVVDPGYAGQLGTPLTQAIAKYLAAVGVKLDIVTKNTNNDYVHAAVSGDYPVIQIASIVLPTAQGYGWFFKRDGILNHHGWSDPVIDRLHATALTAKDPVPYWRRIWQRSVTQALFVPVMHNDLIYFAARGITGVELSPQAPVPFPTDWSAE